MKLHRLCSFGCPEAAMAGIAAEPGDELARPHFAANFHVRRETVCHRQRDRPVLVKGGPGGKLLTKAVRINVQGKTRDGRPLKVLSPEMQVAVLCRREGIHANVYDTWLKEYMEAGKARLKGEATRGATRGEVEHL